MTEGAPRPLGAGPLKVVIADENPASRRFMMRVVQDCFVDESLLRECSDTASALALMEPDVDLVLIDQQLPEGGAVEFLRRELSHPALKIVTTLYSDDERLFDLIRLGAAGYLLQEDRFEVQVEQLQRIAQGSPPLSPAIARCALAALGIPAATGAALTSPLEPEETDVLNRLSRGYTLREVASSLALRASDISAHIASIYRKLQTPAALA